MDVSELDTHGKLRFLPIPEDVFVIGKEVLLFTFSTAPFYSGPKVRSSKLYKRFALVNGLRYACNYHTN